MGTIVKPNTFTSGATIIAAEHNDNFDTIYNEFNGNIDNDNIKASAGIVGSKLDLSAPGTIGATTPGVATFENVALTTASGGTPIADTLYTNSITKAWVNFSGTGTPTILESFNVTSLTTFSTIGEFAINWTTTFANNTYCIIATSGTSAEVVGAVTIQSFAVDNAKVKFFDSNHSGTNPSIACIVAFGTQ